MPFGNDIGGSGGRGSIGGPGGGPAAGMDGQDIGGRGRSTRDRDSRSRSRSRGRDGDQRADRLRLRETPDSPATRNPQQAPDPAPKTQEQIEADRVAMLAEVRRRGRGQTVIGASRRLGEAVGPTINRPTLGG